MLSFFSFDLDNFLKKARQELVPFIKREARTRFIQVVKQAQNSGFLVLFPVIIAHCLCEAFVSLLATECVFSIEEYGLVYSQYCLENCGDREVF